MDPTKRDMEMDAEAAEGVAEAPAPKRARTTESSEGGDDDGLSAAEVHAQFAESDAAVAAATLALTEAKKLADRVGEKEASASLVAASAALDAAVQMRMEATAAANGYIEACKRRIKAAEARTAKLIAKMAAIRAANAAAEAEAEEAADRERELGMLWSAVGDLCAASPIAARRSCDCDKGTAAWRVCGGWNPVADPQIAALLARLTANEEVVTQVRACLPTLAKQAAALAAAKKADKRTAIQGVMSSALRELEVAVGDTRDTGTGTWCDDAELVVWPHKGDDPCVSHADHGWRARPHLVANTATLTLTMVDNAVLSEAVTGARQQGAMRMRLQLQWRFDHATPAARAALKKWTYAFATDGAHLVVVRTSVNPCRDDGGYYVHVQESVALPLWKVTKGRSGHINGLPPGLAVLVALMLAQGDELGSPPLVPPTGLDFQRVPEAAAVAVVTDEAAWVAPLDLGRADDWPLLGCGGFAFVHAVAAPDGSDMAVKVARSTRVNKDCLAEAKALARIGNAGTAAPAGCAFIPRLVGGAWQAVPAAAGGTQQALAALVLSHVGVTLDDAVARMHGAARWAVVLHAIVAVLHALHHAHSVGVAHRDVRVPNVIYARAPCPRAGSEAAAGAGGAGGGAAGGGAGGRTGRRGSAAGGGASGGAAAASAAHARHGVCLNDWGLALLDDDADMPIEMTMARDLHMAKLLLLLLGKVSNACAQPQAFLDLQPLPAAAAVIACCPGLPAGAAHRTHLKAFLAAKSVQDALDALAPLHAALVPELDALDWVPWRVAQQTPCGIGGTREEWGFVTE